MAEMPELKVVIAKDLDATIYGQGLESTNALVMAAHASALFDAAANRSEAFRSSQTM
jgi:hypothetical protein